MNNLTLKTATEKNRIPTIIKHCKSALDRRMDIFQIDQEKAFLKVLTNLWETYSTDDLIVQFALNPGLENIKPSKAASSLREHLTLTLDHILKECLINGKKLSVLIKDSIVEQNIYMKVPQGAALSKKTQTEISKVISLIKRESFLTRIHNIRKEPYKNDRITSLNNVINEMNLEMFRPLIIEKNKVGLNAQKKIAKSTSYIPVKTFSVSNVRQVIDALHNRETEMHEMMLVS